MPTQPDPGEDWPASPPVSPAPVVYTVQEIHYDRVIEQCGGIEPSLPFFLEWRCGVVHLYVPKYTREAEIHAVCTQLRTYWLEEALEVFVVSDCPRRMLLGAWKGTVPGWRRD